MQSIKESRKSIPDKLFILAEAFNSRSSSVTVGDDTYDFSNVTGKIAFYLCGHSHYDAIGTYQDIPVMVTTNAFPLIFNPSATDKVAFDLLTVDYDNAKMYATRVGLGSDRQMRILV